MNTCQECNLSPVAYLRMPLALSAMDAMNRFIERAYGKYCVCTEEPQGWLKISTLNAHTLFTVAQGG